MPILEVKDEPEIDIEDIVDEIGTEELEDIEAIAIDVPPVEEVIVKTRLTMPSRKLKVNISSELLQELEKMQLNFKLNQINYQTVISSANEAITKTNF